MEYEDNARQRKKLIEAKIRAQRWLSEIKEKGVKKLSFRKNRTSSEMSTESCINHYNKPSYYDSGNKSPKSEKLSLRSNPVQPISSPIRSYQQRAASCHFLPEIIVTTIRHDAEVDDSTPSSRPISRLNGIP